MVGVSSYLDAIQEIKGMTPDKKYQTILEHIKKYVNIERKILNSKIWDETGQHLRPLYKLIIANMTRNYNMISELLKSEDEFITCKVLKCRWYFQGKNEKVINPKHFFRNIIPFVTLKTRQEIVKSLGRNLKNRKMAEKFFIEFELNYGVNYSIPLLFACNDDFVKKKILEHRIIFSVNQVDRLYLRKPNVIIYYFNLIESRNNVRTSVISQDTIQKYVKFLPKLIKRNHNMFYDIVKSWSLEVQYRSLDKKYVKNILKKNNNGESILEKNPRIWIEFIDRKMISEIMMNTIFPKLLPEFINKFNTDKMIRYLEHYPKDKIYKLISESYESVYNKKFIDNLDNITFEFLPFVPKNIRNDVLHLLKLDFTECVNNYQRNYDSYLPTSANIDNIKAQIKKADNPNDRVPLIIKMVYNCKVNDDCDALYQFLEYVYRRHRNERSEFWISFFSGFLKIYELNEIRLKEWSGIDLLIQNLCRNCMFHKIPNYSLILQVSILVKYKDFYMFNSAKEFINIYLHMVREHYINRWSKYDGNPQDEDLFFTIMLDYVEKKFVKNKSEQDTSSSEYIQETYSGSESNREHYSDAESNRENNSYSESNREYNSYSESNSENYSDFKSNSETYSYSDTSLNTSEKKLWDDEVRIFCVTDLVLTMYELDKKYGIYTNNKKIKKKKTTIIRNTILSVPFRKWRSKWLWSQVEDLLTNKDKIPKKSMKYFNELESSVKQRDPELYEKLLDVTLPEEFNFKVSAPFKMLKKDPKQVLNNIPYFLDTAVKSNTYHSRRIRRFFIMCRWYNKLPMKFVEEAKRRLSSKHVPYYLYLMAIILDGQSFQDAYKKYLSENGIDNFNELSKMYHLENKKLYLLEGLLKGIQMSNPPLPLETMADFYEYDFSYVLNISEIILNVCRKSSFKKVKEYLRTMSHKKVILKKNVIRIYGFAETIENFAEYLLSRWKIENEHPSVRIIIFKTSNKLFANNPKKFTWSTFKYILESYEFEDWEYYRPKYIQTDVIPIEYINDMIKTIILMTTKIIDISLCKNTNVYRIKNKVLDFLFSTIYVRLSSYYIEFVDDKIILNFIEKYYFQEEFINDERILLIVVCNYLFADRKQCLPRYKKFCKIMENRCEDWYNLDLKDVSENPIRKGISSFIKKIKTTLLSKNKCDWICPSIATQIINETLKTFYKVPVYTNIWLYIMLQFTKYYIVSPEDFVENICTIFIKSCANYKCSYIIFARAIEQFLFAIDCNDTEDVYYRFINNLLNNRTCTLSKLTAVLLLPVSPTDDNMYHEVLDKFKALNDPEVFCLLYTKLNRSCFLDDSSY
ncbi:PREDICTED: uncharacterized protein LOC106787295 [Polistes canadensis]|uniref:uncharacterized protein LOC106787295 n=1 Tax=Polistes canadensis TaxID=91411 RepID=UPI000718CB42|nr:PREDICTED: uncharacterized protein LOC106787295 [Polistes canadensis]XP_014605015.1 PREDICTED: uncharacterized protein LOC106787295 [Polistes canadensis]